MSNKKTIPTISSSEASKMSVSALAVRPNDASRFGQGGLSAKALQEWFDKLPNLVKEKFNEIAQTLASAEAAKYIGTDALGVDNLYDFLLLFGPRGTGINDKNISDYIETLYAPLGESTEKSVALKDIVSDIARRLVDASAGHVVDARLESVTNTLVITFADGTDARVDLSPLAAGVGIQGEIDRLKETDADLERRLSNIEEHISDDYFVTDDSVAYKKAVPARACTSAKLASFGGMTYRDEATNTLRDSKVTEIKNYGVNLFDKDNANVLMAGLANTNFYSQPTYCVYIPCLPNTTYTASNHGNLSKTLLRLGTTAEVPTLNSKVIDYKYGEMEIKSLSITTSSEAKYLVVMLSQVEYDGGEDALFGSIQIQLGDTATEYKPFREPISYPIPAEIQAINGYGKDGFVIDLEKQTSAYEGEESPLPVSLDPIIKVDGGGSLEFVNEYKNPVPSAVKYLLKEESAV